MYNCLEQDILWTMERRPTALIMLQFRKDYFFLINYVYGLQSSTQKYSLPVKGGKIQFHKMKTFNLKNS